MGFESGGPQRAVARRVEPCLLGRMLIPQDPWAKERAAPGLGPWTQGLRNLACLGLAGLALLLGQALSAEAAAQSKPGLGAKPLAASALPREVSGIYPSLAMFNREGECGTGGVVPWAGRLWVMTYGPHLPLGSSDKLYEITPQLQQVVRPESVGGTPANRLIHDESKQLLLGPYVIDAQGGVRVLPPSRMPGRLTGTARHLSDPANKVYYATMEEGLYEVDVRSLEVRNLIADGNAIPKGFKLETPLAGLSSALPGYHGKGLYSGQGRLIYANNGERSEAALRDPTTPSGALAQWQGEGDWQLLRRNQFTEVTGPGGLHGNRPDDPIWSLGWDAKSLLLMLLDHGQWSSFRLPKVSHSYDGAHGWNTEWPRIRDIGESELLMTMHGAFWRFPRDFSAAQTKGIRVRGAYLKVIGDFCRWNDRLVFGCDDSAKSEFLNKRRIKGGIDSIGQSQSNLWFARAGDLDRLGPPHASGALWLHEPVRRGQLSDPFLVAGWKHRSLWLVDHARGSSQRFDIEEGREWLQQRCDQDSADFSAVITLAAPELRGRAADPIFEGLTRATQRPGLTGLFRPRGEDKRSLSLVNESGYYELDAQLELRKVEDKAARDWVAKRVALPKDVVTLDEASVLIVDDRQRRWRLPRATQALDAATRAGQLRLCREVATERDMLNVAGTFFELPAENADGFAKIRPVCSHDLRIQDFGGYRGMFLMTGLRADAAAGPHVLRSSDGKAALWAGVTEDLWKLGKPRGEGGPWKQTAVKAGQPSDPYLLWGYDRRALSLEHDGQQPVQFEVELDLTGTGLWVTWLRREVSPGESLRLELEPAVQARWLRVSSSEDCRATAWLIYD